MIGLWSGLYATHAGALHLGGSEVLFKKEAGLGSA